MWKHIQKKTPIWFFDSTGCIFKSVNNKDPQLYSIIMHDKKNKQLIPLFEFIDTERNEDHILLKLKLGLGLVCKINGRLKLSSESIYPKIVVVDNSWAMINSVSLLLNKIEIIEYLYWCYEVLIKDNMPTASFMVIIYLCHFHLEKNFLRAIKKFKDGKGNKLFLMAIYAYTLIQNSIEIEQLTTYLKHVQIIFCSRYFTKNVQTSIEFLRCALKFRSSNKICFANYLQIDVDGNNIISETEEQQSNKAIWCNNTIFIENRNDPLLEASPFTKYFGDLFKKMECNLNPTENDNPVQNENKNLEYEENRYFQKEVFGQLTKKLYICPMCTGLMLEKFQKEFPNIFKEKFVKLDNNQVESYLGDVQYNLIKDLKNLYPSEYSIRQYIRIKGTFIESFDKY